MRNDLALALCLLMAMAVAPAASAQMGSQELEPGVHPFVSTASAGAGCASVGNGRIAFARLSAGVLQIFTINPDGSGELQLTTTSGSNEFPAWSRDGLKIAFTSSRSGSPAIWVMDANGANQTQITFTTTGGDFVPEWSRDGSRIAFARVEAATPHPEVWVMNADGSNPVRLTFTPPAPIGPTWSLHPSWSLDDQLIYYASTASGSTQIWRMQSNGSGQTQLTNGLGAGFPNANAPDMSYDGAQVVFWAGFEEQFGEVWVMNPDGTGAHVLTQTMDPRNSDNPAWSPDGSMILFDTNRAVAPGSEFWVMNADGSNPMLLLPNVSGQVSWQTVAPPPTGDLNGDGVVGAGDLAMLIGSWGACPASPLPCPADLDGDGAVTAVDLATLIGNWN